MGYSPVASPTQLSTSLPDVKPCCESLKTNYSFRTKYKLEVSKMSSEYVRSNLGKPLMRLNLNVIL